MTKFHSILCLTLASAFIAAGNLAQAQSRKDISTNQGDAATKQGPTKKNETTTNSKLTPGQGTAPGQKVSKTPLFEACTNLPRGLTLDFSPLPPIQGKHGCGAQKPLKLEAFTTISIAMKKLAFKRRAVYGKVFKGRKLKSMDIAAMTSVRTSRPLNVRIKPTPTLNCAMAASLGRWMGQIVQPLALKLLGEPVIRLVNVSSYRCRKQDIRAKGRLSEHAKANALDIAAFVLASGKIVSVKKHWGGGDKRARFLYAIHRQACGLFGTSLGPVANAAHHDHFHLDMARRRSGFCE